MLSRANQAARLTPHLSLIVDELNVHDVRFPRHGAGGRRGPLQAEVKLRTMGPKVGKKVQRVKQLLETANAGALRAEP